MLEKVIGHNVKRWYTINYENLENLKTDTPANHEISPSDHNEQTICSNPTDELLNLDRPCVQNEQSSCSNWTEDVLNLNTPLLESTSESTTKNTSETSSSSKETYEKEDPFRFFEQNGFETIGGFIADKIKAWCTDLSDDFVIEAMKLAVENSSKRWSYVEAILRDWVEKGYQTLDDVHAARLAYKNQMNHSPMKKPPRQEYIPEWFQKREQNHEATHDTAFKRDKGIIEEQIKKRTEQGATASQEPTHKSSFEEKKRLFEERLKMYR
ncbi:DnaD domain-containing protein [Bacillus timonensis]|uniref:DnaD domain-containing protein n=1 Tax=Bacillus timonensis TaxID=1033734 RepID=UPI001F5FAA0D|nr:DnaD domain protein [Bacillus timonensis]